MKDERFIDWCVWKILVPLALLVLFWPVYGVILDLPHPFERAFAHGELLIFGALLLIEASVEAEQVKRTGASFHAGQQVARGFAVLMIFAFGFIRYDAIVQEDKFEASSALEAIGKLTSYSRFNLLVAAVAVLYSIYSFWRCTSLMKGQVLEIIAGEKEGRR